MPNFSIPPDPQEPYYTIKDAAKRLRFPYWKVLRACNAGIIPTHRLFNSRRYVRLEEVQQAITAHSMLISGEGGKS